MASFFVATVLVASFASAKDTAVICATAAEEGQGLKVARKLTASRREFITCSREECPLFIRNDCLNWLREVTQSIPSVVVRAKGGDGLDLIEVRVMIDGAVIKHRLDGAPIELDPGEHSIELDARSYAPYRQTVLVAQGEKERPIAVTMTPSAPADSPKLVDDISPPSKRAASPPYFAYGLGAAGIAALGAFAFFEVKGHSDLSDLEDTCGRTRTCREGDVDAVRTKFVMAGVSLGVGIVLLGVATVLGVTHDSSPKSTAKAIEWGPGYLRF